MSDIIFDVLVILGLVGLGVALGLAWGWVSVLAYGSTVCLIVGIVGAYVWKKRRGA
jgi:uncharacterized membrane protein (Fun14 family)